MWKAVLVHGGGTVLPSLGEYSDWRMVLVRCLGHVGLLAPGRYRLGEVGVDRVGDAVLVFAVLTHPRERWILNAVAPEAALIASAEAPPSVEEVRVFLENLGFARKWVLVQGFC